MNVQKIIITSIIILVLALGGVLGVALWSNSGSKTPAQNEEQQTPVGGTQTSTNGQQGSVVTPTTGAIDSKKEYDSLFSTLKARRLILELVGSPTGPYGSVYSLYSEDIALAKKIVPDASGYTMHMASTDLNGDGTAEVVVYEDLPGMCGTGGCEIDVYKKNGTTYELILSALGYEYIGVASSQTNGFTDLNLSHHGETGFMTNVVKYTWSGNAYNASSTVATWDGEQFKLVK